LNNEKLSSVVAVMNFRFSFSLTIYLALHMHNINRKTRRFCE